MISVKKYLLLGITLLLCFTFSNSLIAQIQINEFQAYNASDYLDTDNGNYSDWIELYNSNNTAINLGGCSLTDDITQPQKWIIPFGISIPANGYLILWADKMDYENHMNFSIRGKEGQLFLLNDGEQIMDSISYTKQIPNISFGRSVSDGKWGFLGHSTPGIINDESLVSIEPCMEPLLNLPGGFYSGPQEVTMIDPNEGANIFYTLDGSVPDVSSNLYASPILISNTTVLRAVSYLNNNLPSKIATATYFIDQEFTLPVISISTNNDNLWDSEIGIYTQENCEKDWERPANMEFFELDGSREINMEVGINIYGDYSQLLPMKSLAIRARNKYGSDEINYKFFKDKDIDSFTSLILRNSGNDWGHSLLRDGFMQSIVKDRMDIDYQEYRPSIIFINGAYWGIHNIREKMNEYYLEGNHHVDPDSVDLLAKGYIVSEGDDVAYHELLDFMVSNSLKEDENYAFVKQRVDIEELINYQIAQIYFKNKDWPKGNIKKWRARKEHEVWRWLLFDTDWGFGLHGNSENMVEWTIAQNNWYLNFNSRLFHNNEFKYDFLQCFQSHLNTTFQPERVIHLMDSLKTGIESEIPGHVSRWELPESVSSWESEMATMQDFANQRIEEVKTELMDYFGGLAEYNLTLDITKPDGGSVKINHVEIPDGLSGSYYKNIPIKLEAIPEEGYYFVGWTGSTVSPEKNIDLTLSSDAVLTAHFDEIALLNNIKFNEISSFKENGVTDESGDTVDWIEIINVGETAADITGLYLTDSTQNLTKHKLVNNSGPIMLQPDSLLVLFADNETEEGYRHLNFKLSNAGEELSICQRYGDLMVILDSVKYGPQIQGNTYGRIDGEDEIWKPVLSTPGAPNIKIPYTSNVFINEFSASNQQILADAEGSYYDWIEIYNDNSVAVDIGGMFLTDSLADRTKFRIPCFLPDSTTIAPKGHLVFWADNQPEKGVMHLNFGLKRSGEQIGLFQRDGIQIADSLSFSKQYRNASSSRFPDGENIWHSLPPSPGDQNIIPDLSDLHINEFSASNNLIVSDGYGEFDDWIEIYNGNNYPVDIGGLFITDTFGLMNKDRIPTTSPDSTTIPSKSYLVLWADNQPEQGILHLNFGLKRSGEQIGLSQQDGLLLVDSLSFSEQFKSASSSRYPDGENIWHSLPPSPGDQNIIPDLSDLHINEFSASNNLIVSDRYGEFDDWIEIYNGNNYPVDIGGLFITDTFGLMNKDRIPTTSPDSTTIPAGGFMLLWADNQDFQGVLHLDFSLSRQGEQIGLYNYDGHSCIDTVTYDEYFSSSSISRYPDANNSWIYMIPTPGASNITDEYMNIFINEFSAGGEDGQEAETWIEIFNLNDHDVNIGGMYLTDNLNNPGLQQIPLINPDLTTITAGGFIVIGTKPEIGYYSLSLDFPLYKDGGEIGLSQWTKEEFKFVDSIQYTYQGINVSTGRARDGLASWTNFQTPTPGQPNYVKVTSIEQNQENTLNVFPNPVSTGILYFSDERNVYLFNQLGICVKQANNSRKLSLNGLNAGLYFLKTDRAEIIRIILE